MVGAHRDHESGAREDLAGHCPALMRANVEAFRQQVLAHVRSHDVRIVVRPSRADRNGALLPQLATKRVFRGEAAEDVTGAHENDHCARMPETLTMRCAASISDSTKRENSFGVMAIGSAPRRERRSRTSGV